MNTFLNNGNQKALALSIGEVMAETQLGRNKVLELVHSGKLGHIRVGRRIIVPRRELEAFLERELVKESNNE